VVFDVVAESYEVARRQQLRHIASDPGVVDEGSVGGVEISQIQCFLFHSQSRNAH